jgi:hypothetical protein
MVFGSRAPGGIPIKLWLYVLAIVGLILLLFFLPGVFAVVLIIIICYVFYRYGFKRYAYKDRPAIRHGLLKGHLTSKYGDAEGSKLYREIVETLKRKGYR